MKMQVEHFPIDEVKPYPKNPRKNKAAIEDVAESIRQYGFNVPIIVNADKVIICGHTRFEAAKLLGMANVPVLVKTGLSDKQERAFRIADNRVAEEAEWDKWKLRSEFSELFSDNDDFFTGFSDDEIGKFMNLDLGFRNGKDIGDNDLPAMLFPVEIACNERQWETFQKVMEKLGKKKNIDVVMALCEKILAE